VSWGLCGFVVETNGIDLSPDGKTLFVGESDTREIWSYRIDGTKMLSPRLVTRFADFDIDGLRTDTSGNLYVARIL
jgi:sugar lactone lactonase YvrE